MRRFLITVFTALALGFAAVEAGCDHAHIQDIKNSDVYNIHAHAKNYSGRHSTCDDQGLPYD